MFKFKPAYFDQKETIYREYLRNISGIFFSFREIEIIACLINNRTNQNVSNILSIASSTVESHIYNIRVKLKYIPKNQIIDFIENSGKLNYLKEFYIQLVLEKTLQQSLKKIFEEMKCRKSSYKIETFFLNDQENKILEQIKNYLKVVNIVENSSEDENESIKIKVYNKIAKFNKSSERIINICLFQTQDDNIFKNEVIASFDLTSNYYISLLNLINNIIVDENIKSIIDLSIFKFQKIYESLNPDTINVENQARNRSAIINILGISILLIIILAIIILSSNNYKKFTSPYYQKLIYTSFKDNRIKPFIGREDYLKIISQKLIRNKIVSIIGLHGVGKSSLALEYGYRESEQEKIVIWFEAGNLNKIYNEFYSLAQDVGIDTNTEKDRIVKLFYRKIAFLKTDIIFIFDNIDSYETLKPFLVNLPSNIKVIITSCNNDFIYINEFASILLQPFSEEEAKLYIKFNLSKEEDFIFEPLMTKEIIKEVGLLPYELSKVVGYFYKNKYADFEQYKKEQRELSNVNILLKDIKIDSTHWKILKYASYLDSDFIDFTIIENLLNIHPKTIKSAAEDLERFLLIKILHHKKTKGIKLHDLVRRDMQQSLIKNNISEKIIFTEIINSFNKLWQTVEPSKISEYDWNKVMNLVPHVTEVLGQYQYGSDQEFAELAYKLGSYYHYRTIDFVSAKKWYELSLNAFENLTIKQYSQDYINLLLLLCTIHHEIGDIENALKISEQLLDISYKVYKKKDTYELADALNAVGKMHYEYGEFQKALEYYLQALNIGEKLSKDSLAFSMIKYTNNISQAYYELGDIEMGMIYNKQAIEISKKLEIIPGRGTIISLVNMSYALFKIGNLSENFKYASNALEISKNFFSSKPHKVFASAYNMMGLTYYQMGNWNRSFEHFYKSIEIYKELIGDRPYADFGKTLNNLGAVNIKLGKINEGIDYYNKALNIFNNLYNKRPKQIQAFAIIYSNLSDAFSKKKDYERAAKYSEDALKIYDILSFKKDNPDYGLALQRLGVSYYGLGKKELGLKCLEEAINIQINSYSNKNHPHIAESLEHLHKIYASLGDEGKSFEYLIRAYACLNEYYGKNHNETTILLQNTNFTSEMIEYRIVDRRFIMNISDFSNEKYQVKIKLTNILNKIQNLSAKGVWNNYWHYFNGIEAYLKDEYLLQQLGDLANQETLNIAKELCFEAINIGIISIPEEKRQLECAFRFTQTNNQIVRKLLEYNSEYFVDYKLLELYKKIVNQKINKYT